MSAKPKVPRFETLADLLANLGGISPQRVRANPSPGTATEMDLIKANDHTGRLFELVDGALVEKVVGYPEAALALELAWFLREYLGKNDLGLLAGSDGSLRLLPGLVRLPDISFISWKQLPKREIPHEAIPGLAPDLAVEVLSQGNTRKEMARKLREYFLSGTRLVWYVDLKRRTVQAFTAPDEFVILTEDQTLEGGEVLPGFALSLRQLFSRVPQGAPKRNPQRSRKPKGGNDAGENA